MNKSSNEHNSMRKEDVHIETLFSSIERVPAPPFLFARIRERVSSHVENVPRGYVWVSAVSLCVILSFNVIFLLRTGAGRSGDDRQVFANSIGFSADNNLYR